MRLIHIQLKTGVSNKLKHFKATDSQRQLRKILRLFSIVLFVLFIIVFFCRESPCCCTFLYIARFMKNARLLYRDMLKYPELVLQ